MGEIQIDTEKLNALIAEARASGGSELANYQLFIERLCVALNLPRPAMAQEQNELNDYVFERRVDFKHPNGTRSAGRIDCYRRGCFILEAKQSGKRQGAKIDPGQLLLIPEDATQRKPGQAKRGTRGWDVVMLAARKQAEDYARALPIEHGYPPFLLVVDVGHTIEVFADFSGQGKNYAHFPDRQTFRIGMDDLRDGKVQARLRAIWTDPLSLDPTRISAEVTRDIAERLAKIAKRLEGKHDAKDVAEFLMRCLFTMFAEDVKLIPEKGFQKLLGQMKDTPEHFVAALESLWAVMDGGGYAPHLNATLKKFNGSLFKKRAALPLDKSEINELWIAASKDWSNVEPAIFGTLLERALDPRERSKLGAHYTPRAYVERLVVPTIIEPLRADWELVKGQVKELRDKSDHAGALAAVKAYHHTLCTTRVLDPACGTGNFLYVSLELMKRLEGEVLEALDDLGEDQARFAMEGETVSPRQYYGLELNPRAVPIADLVLWIGYLKWQLKTAGLMSITEPILHAYGTIKQQDAVLSYDRQELLRDADGRPLSRWDGVTKKHHPISGEEIPDPDATVPLYTYVNPKCAPWPEVEFIVGNPPFIGGKDMRHELGDGYAEACWAARPHLPGGADFVMHFWDEAASRLLRKPLKDQTNPLRRFGFITTNSITQTFSRRVIERHMAAKEPLSLVFAVPNHPWMKATDKAAVRIAMTVAVRGEHEGVLAEVVSEAELNTDTPLVVLEVHEGRLRSNLNLGVSLAVLLPLSANAELGIKGFMPYGRGFMISANVAQSLQADDPHIIGQYIRKYVNGRDLNQKSRQSFVIDFHGLGIDQIRTSYPRTYQHLLQNVKPERDQNPMDYRREKWWLFGRPGNQLRDGLAGLDRYIGTTETSRHRLFRFVDGDTAPDQKVRVVASPRADILAVLSSRVHVTFALARGGWQGVGNDPVYSHTTCFDPFPFPLTVERGPLGDDFRFAQHERIGELGQQLDTFRKQQLTEHSFLTMTALYNTLERVRELENVSDVPPLTDAEREVHQAGLVSVLAEIHDDIDRAVLTAYGWGDLIPTLVGKPGATLPSLHKTEAQEQAEEDLLTRLVVLNQERAAEERRGLVRWLRPDYQIPKLGVKAPKVEGEHVGTLDIELPDKVDRPKWPTDGLEQIRLVRDLLAKAPAPSPSEAIATVFDGRNTAKRRDRIEEVLETLVATGLARTGEHEGQRRYFLPR
ncbi:class I SAM-dependent DNA methyltransferase [Mesorhizobium sp. M3A.F.Ca.ET.174.01.1.1]|uniref:class I SAM-dependent DNA methyltransferase n=1 Tax=unclassified Mesorhizobium TaxID=325217 RepID=UPI0010934C8F|nr:MULTISPECIES: DNA methyltransferase [unclassified Mesorhizobium]TGS82739.1 class I SAM-dependent DNA methyltransferase [Mesorhizobium sp. M3A.F.Ca.ET.175.01.1.1]TGT22694.1 class I SAM-dependent DNA methyltransferase [Mesorhizobium sp. M3A.F.Ca.ET.174.01.1.1]